MQIDYTKTASSGSSSASSGSSSGGGGGGTACISNWQCSKWAQCIEGFRARKCLDNNQCAFPGKKPAESEQCPINEAKETFASVEYTDKIKRINQSDLSKGLLSITGQAVKLTNKKFNLGIFIIFLEIVVVVGAYLLFKNTFFLKIFK